MPPKKGQSSYMLFCNEHRAAARAACLAETGAEKISVAVVAKQLGMMWKNLTDEEKAHYQALANQKAAAEAPSHENAQQNDDTAVNEKEGEETAEPEAEKDVKHPFGFPLNPIRRIMTQDPDVIRISSGALQCTAKATQLLIEQLVAKAQQVVVSNKRSNIRFQDVERVLSKDRRWEVSGVLQMLQEGKLVGKFPAEGANHAGERPKAVEEDPKARKITSFFTA